MDSALPNHVAIIPDGNRRWAKGRGLTPLEGHKKGFDVVINSARYLRKKGVHTFTIWGFSTENWSRQKKEIAGIFAIGRFLDNYVKEALRDGVRIIHLGRKDRLPSSLLKIINNAEDKTRDMDKHVFNIAFDYGGKDEILRAVNKINDKGLMIDEDNLINNLDTAGQPYPSPDLIIRTSGEQRTSGFMLWQTAYSEYIFLDKYFPDLSEQDIDEAIEEYGSRKRRFGK